MDSNQKEILTTVVQFADRSRRQYWNTKLWTRADGVSCETIRVPVALLNRIRELGETFNVEKV